MSSEFIPLSDGDVKNWLRSGSAITDEDTSSILASIQYHEERLYFIGLQVKSILDPAPPAPERRPSFCGLSLNWRRRKAKKTVQDEPSHPQLKRLYASQVASRFSIHILSSALAPIRRLPPEILSEIFRFCLPETKFIRSSSSQAPLLLTQVCSSWRSISISTPSLWSSLEIGRPLDFHDKVPENDYKAVVTALVDMWFSRAGDRLLSFSVQEDNLKYRIVPETLERFGSRWQHLKIRAPKSTCMVLQSEVDYRALETLELQTIERPEDVVIEELSEAALKAPNLRHFIWDNGGQYSSRLELPWTNLTRLTLNAGIEVDRCLTIMSKLNNVTHLSFQHIIMSNVSLPNLTITLPKLTSLVISAEFPLGDSFFGALTAPRLKELVLNLAFWPHGGVIRFLRRSKCPLESLNLYFAPITDAELIECLETVQNTLKEFTIQASDDHHRPITDALLDRLTYNSNRNVLCPHVEVIALYRALSCTTGHFAEMVLSRLTPASSDDPEYRDLATLKVIETYSEEADYQELKPLRSLGLILKLYSYGTGQALEMQPEEMERLRRLREEGLVLRVYSSATGFFGEAD